MKAEVNGIRMAYRTNGRPGNPAVLLLHGFPLDSDMWEAQLESLADQAYVVAPDLRGHGASDAPEGPYSLAQHADDVAALLAHLRLNRAVVVGLSMGGYVAFALWQRHRDRIAGLGLVDTRASADTPEGRAGRVATAARVREQGVHVLADEMLPRLTSEKSQRNADLTRRLREMILRQRASGMSAALLAMRDRPDYSALLADIRVPTAVVVGEEDVITPPDVAASIAAAIPGARLVKIAEAGHMSPMENPAEVNAALAELLTSAR